MFGNTPTFLPVPPHPFCQDESKISVCATFSRQSMSLRVFRENLTRVSDGFLANRERCAGSALAWWSGRTIALRLQTGRSGLSLLGGGPGSFLISSVALGPSLSRGVPRGPLPGRSVAHDAFLRGDRLPLEPRSGDSTLPPVPPASSHPGAQISTLEFFTG